PLGDTWEWNGTVWAQRTATGPPARSCQGAAYDSLRHLMVVFGGNVNPTLALGDTWEFDGSGTGSWTQRTPIPSAPPTGLAFDSPRGVSVLFGGWTGSLNLADTWEWNSAGVGTWTQRAAAGGPSGRRTPLAYDSQRHVTVLFGGVYYDGTNFLPLGETWE